MDEAVNWFPSLDRDTQRAVLQEVVRYAMQAQVTAEDGRNGLAGSSRRLHSRLA
ncbi:DUF5958 family protein [Streptomyces sp. S465]|uniref:DUF5958 family protein n=1 Tax=Streptomyces sp. S465 TaxID=2979468 RepID=UPI003FCE9435